MNNKSTELIAKWQSELIAGSYLNYNQKKEVFKSIVEELADHQNYFDDKNVWDMTAIVGLVQNMVEFQLKNDIVFTNDEISGSTAKILGHLSKMKT